MYNLDDVVGCRTSKESDVWAFGMTVLEVSLLFAAIFSMTHRFTALSHRC